MTKEDALRKLDEHASMDHSEREGAVVAALEHGASRQEVAIRLGLSVDDLLETHGLAVKNAGKLGHFRHPNDAPAVVDLDED